MNSNQCSKWNMYPDTTRKCTTIGPD